MAEVFTEEGIVVEKRGDLAEIAIMDKGNCKTCAAKPFCKTNEDGVYSNLTVYDRLGSKPGDEVIIEVKGSDLLKAVMMVYGLPLFLFIFTIGTLIYFYNGDINKEIIAFFSAVLVLAVYYTIIKIAGVKGNVKKENLPKTVKIKKSFQSINH
ncbi:MAG: SoxR reducing system RseC family protein [Ignavibacteriales bacterium]|nr:SoxR reducing system RseC family protein [Ignavibacteriales bacterium]